MDQSGKYLISERKGKFGWNYPTITLQKYREYYSNEDSEKKSKDEALREKLMDAESIQLISEDGQVILGEKVNQIFMEIEIVGFLNKDKDSGTLISDSDLIDMLNSFETYLKEYPNEPYSDEVEKMLDQLLYLDAQTPKLEELFSRSEFYLKNFPKGLKARDCEANLKNYLFPDPDNNDSERIGNLELYLKKFRSDNKGHFFKEATKELEDLILGGNSSNWSEKVRKMNDYLDKYSPTYLRKKFEDSIESFILIKPNTTSIEGAINRREWYISHYPLKEFASKVKEDLRDLLLKNPENLIKFLHEYIEQKDERNSNLIDELKDESEKQAIVIFFSTATKRNYILGHEDIKILKERFAEYLNASNESEKQKVWEEILKIDEKNDYKDLVAINKTPECIDSLIDSLNLLKDDPNHWLDSKACADKTNELILLKSQWAANNKVVRGNTRDPDAIQREFNRINFALLESIEALNISELIK